LTNAFDQGAHALAIEQRPLAQSAFAAQGASLSHPAQLPPQSTALSLPFLTPSEHVGAWHASCAQTPLSQSVASAQPLRS
jgi:hypothetical protein